MRPQPERAHAQRPLSTQRKLPAGTTGIADRHVPNHASGKTRLGWQLGLRLGRVVVIAATHRRLSVYLGAHGDEFGIGHEFRCTSVPMAVTEAAAPSNGTRDVSALAAWRSFSSVPLFVAGQYFADELLLQLPALLLSLLAFLSRLPHQPLYLVVNLPLPSRNVCLTLPLSLCGPSRGTAVGLWGRQD